MSQWFSFSLTPPWHKQVWISFYVLYRHHWESFDTGTEMKRCHAWYWGCRRVVSADLEIPSQCGGHSRGGSWLCPGSKFPCPGEGNIWWLAHTPTDHRHTFSLPTRLKLISSRRSSGLERISGNSFSSPISPSQCISIKWWILPKTLWSSQRWSCWKWPEKIFSFL